MHQTQGSERINEGGAVETNVETVDQRSPAGQSGQEQPRSENTTTVVHLTKSKKEGDAGGVLGSAGAVVANTLRSAKDAIFGKGKDRSHN